MYGNGLVLKIGCIVCLHVLITVDTVQFLFLKYEIASDQVMLQLDQNLVSTESMLERRATSSPSLNRLLSTIRT